MKDYEIDCEKKIEINTIKNKFLKNGFLHLKNILNNEEISLIKTKVIDEFNKLDKNDKLSLEDQKSLNRCEMPVVNPISPRIDIKSYTAHTNSKLPQILEAIFEEDFLWHFPPQMRRLSVKKDIGLLPYHQDCYYNNLYENIIVCWTPLSNCGLTSPSLELVRSSFKERFEHTSNEIWEFGIPSETLKQITNNNEVVSLQDVKIRDVVIFDAFNLHRTFWKENMNEIRYSMDLRAVKKSLIPKQTLEFRKFVYKDKDKFQGKINEKQNI